MATNTVYYYALSQQHQEIDDTLVGAVRFNAEQVLSESQKAQACANIGAAQFGSLLKILGHFDTVEELQAQAEQKTGDAYSVGATTPYDLYIFDGLRSEWKNYGQIRATDISSRYVMNQVIAASSWVEDDSVFADFLYRARIPVQTATTNDFPIVAFDQKEAVSGNFAALAFSFDGYLEIWAKDKPTAAITIPIATIIVNGGNGRGITNATGGIVAGSIDAEDLAADAVKLKFTNTEIENTTFAENATYQDYPYRATVPLTGVLASMTPEIVYSLADATSGNFAPVAECYDGGVYIYAASMPDALVTIPTILCWR